MKPLLCIYHANCLDGFTAAWVVYRCMPHAEFHAGVYGEIPPDCEGRDVVFVDFCYKAEVMQGVVNSASSVVVLDHHKSAVPEIEKVTGLKASIIDMDRSGAMIAWNYFFPFLTPPKIVEHVQDRDLWRFSMEHTKAICAYLFILPQEFKVWDQADDYLYYRYQEVVGKGELLLAKHQKDVEEIIKLGTHRIDILGHNIPAVNCAPMHASDIGNILAQGQPFAAMYQFSDGVLAFSLRSTDEGVDVSEIAKFFGGGGHRNAAGFKVRGSISQIPLQKME